MRSVYVPVPHMCAQRGLPCYAHKSMDKCKLYPLYIHDSAFTMKPVYARVVFLKWDPQHELLRFSASPCCLKRPF